MSNEQDILEFTKSYATNKKEDNERKFKELKELLSIKSDKLLDLKNNKDQLEMELNRLNKEIHLVKEDIRNSWEPFTVGTEESIIDMGEYKLKMKSILNISVEDKECVITWLASNGYKDVMKWDIHHATLKRIAKELFEDNSNPTRLPGLNYTNFNSIDIK